MIGQSRGLASVLLGCMWAGLGLAKVVHPRRAELLEAVLPAAFAVGGAWCLIAAELVVAGLLLWPPRQRLWLGHTSSVVLLCTFGVAAVLGPEATCLCAGHVAPLDRRGRLLLIALMMSLSALALAGDPRVPPRALGRGGPARLRTLAALLVAGACCWVLLCWGTRHSPSAWEPAGLRPAPTYEAHLAPVLLSPLTTKGREAQEPPELLNRGSTTLRVVVSCADDRLPIAGARVWVAPGGGAHMSAGDSAITNDQGRVELPLLRVAPSALLRVMAPGRALWSQPMADLGRDGEYLLVALPSGAGIRGVVVDTRGAPLADVRVQARGARAEGAGWGTPPLAAWSEHRTPELVEAVTGLDGTFRMRGLSEEAYPLFARKEGYADHQVGLEPPAAVLATRDPTALVTIVLSEVFEVRGEAVDEVTGELLPGASCALRLTPGRPWVVATRPAVPAAANAPGSDTAGDSSARLVARLSMQDVDGDPATAVTLAATAFGYLPQEATVVPSRGTASPVRLELRRSTTAPLADVTFRLALDGGRRGPSGTLTAQLAEGSDARRGRLLPLRFDAGVLERPLRLPRGVYAISLRGLLGSLAAWQQPLVDRACSFDIAQDGPVVVDLPCTGSPVCVCPTDAARAPLGHFVLSVTQGQREFRSATWSSTHPFASCDCAECPESLGRVFWLRGGETRLTLFKRGYEPTATTILVPPNGTPVTWCPTMAEHGAGSR